MQTSNIFEFLDWVLKKKEKEPIYENNISNYIINRWLSMSDLDVCKIINVSTNRWDKCIDNSENFLDNCKFYKTLLPKIHKKIEYIKKKGFKNEEESNEDVLAKEYEISKREIDIYNKLLENIKTEDK
jgi:hypothetical protein